MFIPDPGCLSRIPNTDFYPSRIPNPGSRIQDPKTATKERDEKNLWSYLFIYIATNFTKLKIILVLKCWRKKLGPIFKGIVELFTTKNVIKLTKNMGLDPGSGKNLFRIPDPGAKKAQDPGSGSAKLAINISAGVIVQIIH
jgi:hypothetical protein